MSSELHIFQEPRTDAYFLIEGGPKLVCLVSMIHLADERIQFKTTL